MEVASGPSLRSGRQSAGLLIWRRRGGTVEFLLVHPGGPYWAKKDKSAWSIPKGEIDAGEDRLEAAQRELKEETGFEVEGPFQPLQPVKQKAGKVIHAWAVEAPDLDPAAIRCNSFDMEWPPRSGKRQSFPECDRAEWFDAAEARERLNPGQCPLLDELLTVLEA